MKAVIHHGGAGTVYGYDCSLKEVARLITRMHRAAGLRCGRPTGIVAFFGDQMFCMLDGYRNFTMS